jgi:hypothetical protein
MLSVPKNSQPCTFRPREFTYAYKKPVYVPTATQPTVEAAPTPETASGSNHPGGPAAKRPRTDGAVPTPTAGRICSTPLEIYNYRYSHQIHKFSLGFMYGI